MARSGIVFKDTTVKVTTEKLPKSLIALQIEIDRDQFERSLDQAARRLSQKFPIQASAPVRHLVLSLNAPSGARH